MHLYKMKLLKIIAEPNAVEHIIETINRFYLRGFTVYDAVGVGRHTRDSSSAMAKRKIVEIVAQEETAEQLLMALHDELFARYAIVAYLEDVKVVRRERFS